MYLSDILQKLPNITEHILNLLPCLPAKIKRLMFIQSDNDCMPRQVYVEI